MTKNLLNIKTEPSAEGEKSHSNKDHQIEDRDEYRRVKNPENGTQYDAEDEEPNEVRDSCSIVNNSAEITEK